MCLSLRCSSETLGARSSGWRRVSTLCLLDHHQPVGFVGAGHARGAAVWMPRSRRDRRVSMDVRREAERERDVEGGSSREMEWVVLGSCGRERPGETETEEVGRVERVSVSRNVGGRDRARDA